MWEEGEYFRGGEHFKKQNSPPPQKGCQRISSGNTQKKRHKLPKNIRKEVYLTDPQESTDTTK